MTISLNLSRVKDKKTLCVALDRELIQKPWGHNWDALNDCLRDLSTGGFTKKYDFPLKIEIVDWNEFCESDNESFTTFKEILKQQVTEHKNKGLELLVEFA